MKKTTKLLSLLCAITAVIMMIPMQLAVGAEEVQQTPANGTVYDLRDGFGKEASFGPYSFFRGDNYTNIFTGNNTGGIDTAALIPLTKLKDYKASWPNGVYYLTEDEDNKTSLNSQNEHFFLFGESMVSTINPGSACNVIVFTAPVCGNYTYNVTAGTWGNNDGTRPTGAAIDTRFPDAWSFGNASAGECIVFDNYNDKTMTKTISLKAGESIYFYFRNAGNGGDVRVTINSFKVTLNKCECTPGAAHEENRVEPTCADGGYDTVTRCTKCNALLSSEHTVLPKVENNHKGPMLTRNVNVVAATCQADGSHDVETYCESCGTVTDTQHVVDAKLTDHTPEAGEPVKENEVAATCHSEGSYDLVTRCKTCGGVMETEHKTTEKTEHTPGTPVRENENLPTVVGKAGSYDEVVYCSVPECKAEISRKTVKVYLKKVNYTLKNFGKTTDFSSNNLTLAFTTEGGGTNVVGSLSALISNPQLLNKLKDVNGAKRYTLGGNDNFVHAELVDGEMRIYAENGGFNAIIFTAPEDGTYTYEFSGHNAWGNDIEVAVNINGVHSTWGKSVNGAFGATLKATDTVTLKKGEKILFIPRLTAGADMAGQKDYFVLESFKVSTVKYVENADNPVTGSYIAASVFACAVAAVVCVAAAKKKKSI